MSNGRKYYVMCENKCLFEGMTKEQTLAAIEQAVTSGEIKDVDTGFVTTIKEQNTGAPLTFWIGTNAQYNAIETKKTNCFYIITDDTSTADIAAAVGELLKDVDDIQAKLAGVNNGGVLLFDGEIAYGDDVNVYVPNMGKYCLFAVRYGKKDPVLCFGWKVSNTIRINGTGNPSQSDSWLEVGVFLSGNVDNTGGVTITSNQTKLYVDYDNLSHTEHDDPITKIYGII